jgi:hypothetical protein
LVGVRGQPRDERVGIVGGARIAARLEYEPPASGLALAPGGLVDRVEGFLEALQCRLHAPCIANNRGGRLYDESMRCGLVIVIGFGR